jgi:hypothetical protein
MHNKYGDLKGRDYLQSLGLSRRIILKCILKNRAGVGIWSGFMLPRIESSGGILWARQETFVVYKRRKIFQVAAWK